MSETTDAAGRNAAVLSAVEVGLGSVLHTFRVPLAGHFLSLNQSFLLSRAVLKSKALKGARFMPVEISTVAAILKSLSPAGKKLTPMLAISAQGLLFGAGTALFGPNLGGAMVGSALSSVWAFIQPVLIYLLLYGQTLIQVANYLYDKTQEAFAFDREDLLLALGLVMAVKLVLSIGAALAASLLSDATVTAYEERLLRAGKAKRENMRSKPKALSRTEAARLALNDLFNPLFIVSLAITAFFFIVSESKTSTLIWGLLRPIAVGFLIFYVVRSAAFESFFKADRLREDAPSFVRTLHRSVRLFRAK